MESLSEYKGKRIQITSNQVGRVSFFKGDLIDADSNFVKFKDDVLGVILIAINSITRIEDIE